MIILKSLKNNNTLQIEIDSNKKIIMKRDSLHFVNVVFFNKGIQEKLFSFLIKNKRPNMYSIFYK